MRLTSKEILAIKKIAVNTFGHDIKVKLFGSRTDDFKRGGDIDLLILAREDQLFKSRALKFKFIDDLQGAIGEQRIDVIITTESHLQKDEFLTSIDPIEL